MSYVLQSAITIAFLAIAGFYVFRAFYTWQVTRLKWQTSNDQITEWAFRQTVGLVVTGVIIFIAIYFSS